VRVCGVCVRASGVFRLIDFDAVSLVPWRVHEGGVRLYEPYVCAPLALPKKEQPLRGREESGIRWGPTRPEPGAEAEPTRRPAGPGPTPPSRHRAPPPGSGGRAALKLSLRSPGPDGGPLQCFPFTSQLTHVSMGALFSFSLQTSISILMRSTARCYTRPLTSGPAPRTTL
jgi:hypothetical protein